MPKSSSKIFFVPRKGLSSKGFPFTKYLQTSLVLLKPFSTCSSWDGVSKWHLTRLPKSREEKARVVPVFHLFPSATFPVFYVGNFYARTESLAFSQKDALQHALIEFTTQLPWISSKKKFAACAVFFKNSRKISRLWLAAQTQLFVEDSCRLSLSSEWPLQLSNEKSHNLPSMNRRQQKVINKFGNWVLPMSLVLPCEKNFRENFHYVLATSCRCYWHL